MSVELLHVYRGDHVESIHRGDIVVVDKFGEVLFEIGSKDKVTYWRSAAKPFQVMPLIERRGIEEFGLTLSEVAMMCASHGGETKHIGAVRSILKKIGLDESFLDCGKSRPMYEGAYRAMLRNGESFLEIHNPCSGKHAGMLALGVLMDLDLAGYIEKSHPIQKMMLKTIAKVTEMEEIEIHVAVDGCGVPVFGLPIYNMAKAYSKLALGEGVLRTVSKAMTENPFNVAGTHRLDTILMEETKGNLVAKLGAESVYCVGLMGNGKAMALKIEDGGYRALDSVVPEVLKRQGFIDEYEYENIVKRLNANITNHRKDVIGNYKIVF
ncbi:MAG: asparaginase [Clostridiales bacterium]|nr:asparaginase [Clostridiales bacterium]